MSQLQAPGGVLSLGLASQVSGVGTPSQRVVMLDAWSESLIGVWCWLRGGYLKAATLLANVYLCAAESGRGVG
jgi:hypothetical protein